MTNYPVLSCSASRTWDPPRIPEAGSETSMCRGLGIDLCEISRMEKLLADEKFLCRFFTAGEIQYVRGKGKSAAQTLAGLFAAREALGKALGSGIDFDLKEAEIRHDEKGLPFYHLTGRLAKKTDGEIFLLSISHDGGIAAAVCVRESADG